MIALTFLIISSIIGAGFATGAELIAFFGGVGLPPWVIAILVGVFLLINIYLIYILDSRGHKPSAFVFIPIYFVFFIAMTAGIAQIAGILTAGIALAISITIVIFGFDKLMWVNKWIMIFVLVTILVVTIPNISHIPQSEIRIGRAILSAIIYSGLNSCMLFPIFSKARKRFKPNQIKIAILASAIIISFFVLIIMSAIREGNAMPILALSNNFFVMVTIFLAIFTSQVISLFNINEATKKLKLPKTKLIIFSTIAFALSLFGFSQIIAFAYPTVGGFMVVYVIIAFGMTKHKQKKK